MKFIKMVCKEHPIKENETKPLFTGYVIDKKGKVFQFDTYYNMGFRHRYFDIALSWEVKLLQRESWSMPHYSVHVNYPGVTGRYIDGVYQKVDIKSTRLLFRIDNFTELFEEEGSAAMLNAIL